MVNKYSSSLTATLSFLYTGYSEIFKYLSNYIKYNYDRCHSYIKVIILNEFAGFGYLDGPGVERCYNDGM